MAFEEQSTSDDACPPGASGDSVAAVVALYKRDIDRTLLRSQLAKTPEERFRDVMRMQAAVEEIRRAGRETRHSR